MKAYFAFLGLATLSGCSSVALSPKTWPIEAPQVIEIISDPAGARIEINDEYMGDAPVTVNFKRRMQWGILDEVHINALPKGPGCAQRKVIASSELIPKKIFFDTGLCHRGGFGA